MNAISCCTSNTKTKTCNKIVMLYSVRNVTEVPLDRQQVRYVLHSYLYNCNSLFTCFLPYQVFTFTQMLSVHFSAFFMHYPRCNTLAVRTRNCRLLQRHFRDVALTPARITDITLSRTTLCAGSHLLSWNGHSLATKKVKKVEKVKKKKLGPYIPYGLFQTTREMCANLVQISSEM